MYGARDAAQNWGTCYRDVHLGMVFQAGKASTCVFYHPTRNVRVVIHGDDFTALGRDADLD
eukprot:15311064-Alexandrium_andersonii.AAC.1